MAGNDLPRHFLIQFFGVYNMAKKVEKVNKDDEVAQDFTNQLSSFLNNNLDIQIESLKTGGVIPYWIDTGSYALNWIIGNDFFKGIPGTRIILISGEPGKGKSFLLDKILGANIAAGGASVKVGIEAAANYDFSSQIVGSEEIAEKIHLVKSKTVDDPITIEKLTSIIYKTIDFQASKKKDMNKSVAIGIDSVTQLTSEKELDSVEKKADGKKAAKDMTSSQKMRELFRTIEQRLEHANVTLIGIGQLTANIPTGGFTPPGTPKSVVNAKGSGFAYASSLTIQMVSDKEIKDAKTQTPIGIRMKMKTTKNRIKFKGRECWIFFYFARGVDKFGGLPELLTRYGVLNSFKLDTDKNGNEKRTKIALGVAGLFDKTLPTFSFIRPDGTEVLFTHKTISEVVSEEILREMNDKLNEIYDGILKESGFNEADLLTSDDPVDEEEEYANGEEE